MMVISLRDVEQQIPKAWHDAATEALSTIKALPSTERAKAIAKKSAVWGKMKPYLAKASHDKCWYCESRQIRSNKDVDHFRPKNRVKESPGADGYWWLAFDWQNYRFSCNFCNSPHTGEETSGGKHDHFPLVNEAKRGRPEQTSRELDQLEEPRLLDPTKFRDVQLLTFDISDGSAAPARTKDTHPTEHGRALLSIELYHLHNPDLQRERFKTMLSIRDRLRAATEDLSPDTLAYDEAVRDLWRSIQADAEYSAAARTMLRGLRAQYPLAEVVLAF